MNILLFAGIFLAFAKKTNDPFRKKPPNAKFAGRDLSVLNNKNKIRSSNHKTERRLDGGPEDCKLHLAESSPFPIYTLVSFVQGFYDGFAGNLPDGVTVQNLSHSEIEGANISEFWIRIVTEYTDSDGSRRLNGLPSEDDMNDVMRDALNTSGTGIVNPDEEVDVNTEITYESTTTFVFTFYVRKLGRRWEANLNIHEWGNPGQHCCHMRQSVAVANFPEDIDGLRLFFVDLPNIDSSAENEFCDSSTQYRLPDASQTTGVQLPPCSLVPSTNPADDDEFVQGLNLTLLSDDSEIKQVSIPSLCQARVSKWEYKEKCGEYSRMTPHQVHVEDYFVHLSNISSAECSTNMETILVHYFHVLRDEENSVHEIDLQKAYERMRSDSGCIDSILFSLTHPPDDDPDRKNRYQHIRAFAFDADMNCVYDREQTTSEPKERFCTLWPGAVEAGWQRPSCCAALTTSLGRFGMIHNGPMPNCMANKEFGGCNVSDHSKQLWSSSEYHDVLLSDNAFRKGIMSLCQSRPHENTCAQSAERGLFEGANFSPLVGSILSPNRSPDGNSIPDVCIQKCTEQWDHTAYMRNSQYVTHSFEDHRLVKVELRCNRGYTGWPKGDDEFEVPCYMLTGLPDNIIKANPYCQKRECDHQGPQPNPGVSLYCNNDGICDPRCINQGHQIRYALPYECDYANEHENQWIGSGECHEWAPCVIPDPERKYGDVHGCERDDAGNLFCGDGEYDIHCSPGHHPTERLRCSQATGNPDWASVPVCIPDGHHEDITEVTDLSAQIVIASGDGEIHDGHWNLRSLFQNAVEEAAHEFGRDVKVDINKAETHTTAIKLHLRMHDHYDDERKLRFRGFGRELGEEGQEFKERIERRIRDENDENHIRVHIGEITFATTILPRSWAYDGGHGEHSGSEHSGSEHSGSEHSGSDPHHEPEPDEVLHYGDGQFGRFQVYVVYGEWCLARYSALPKSMWCRDDHREHAWGCFCDKHFGAFSAAWWKDWTNKGRECYKTLGREMDNEAGHHSAYQDRCRENFHYEDIWERSRQVQEEQQEHGGMTSSRSLRGSGRRVDL